MQTEQFLSELQLQGELLAHAAGYAELQAQVPSCPGWTIADVLAHTMTVHRRVRWILAGNDPDDFSYQRPEVALLESEYRLGLLELIAAIRDAPETLEVYTPWPAGPARQFWARRQAHETAIHRIDVELAVGYGVTGFEPEFAADGVDELLVGMAQFAFATAGVDRAQTVALTPLDANVSWTVRLRPEKVTVSHGADDHADLNVFGLASDLYRWVWNRAGDDEITLRGDLTLADRWHQGLRVGNGREP